jgi:hypothetical protein
VEKDVIGVVNVGETGVNVIETLPDFPIIAMDEGKLSLTVAYPFVSSVGPLTYTKTK